MIGGKVWGYDEMIVFISENYDVVLRDFCGICGICGICGLDWANWVDWACGWDTSE